ncbi:Tfp pilus assembly protein FimT/FimU [Vulgatibacter sp.]|uniref:pilus assembly FimT family protein n=1 Tax=Vulgatibacter sp. TaxID=1971226 RepID=UPI0035665A0A
MKALSTSKNGARGFTLIELGVVVGILALVALVVIPSVEAAFGVKTREEAARVAGSVRAMYSEAVLSGRTCRMVFDLDNGSYWPECAAGRVTVTKTEESLRGKRIEDAARFITGTEEEEAARQEIEAKNGFSAYESGLAPKKTLSEPIRVESVWTQHQTEPYEAGTSFLYFFPNGQTERAYIYVSDEEDTFTIIVNPMTGRARVEAGKVEIPDREMSR